MGANAFELAVTLVPLALAITAPIGVSLAIVIRALRAHPRRRPARNHAPAYAGPWAA